MNTTCPRCDALNAVHHRFCVSCGSALVPSGQGLPHASEVVRQAGPQSPGQRPPRARSRAGARAYAGHVPSLLRWGPDTEQTAALIGLGCVLLLAALVRIIGITDNPPGFFTDEASIGYNAYTVLKHGVDEHGESWPVLFEAFGEFKLPVYIYGTIPFVATLGLTEFAVRLASAAFGIATIITVFLLAGAAFQHRAVALAAAFFLAIMPWHIHYSRTGFGELISFVPFVTLSLYLFIRGIRDDSRLLVLAGAAFGVTLYTYRAAWVVLPLLLILIVVLYWRELMDKRTHALSGAAVLAVISIPILLHLLSDSGDRSQDAGILKLGLGTGETINLFIKQYLSHFSLSFLFFEGDEHFITRHYLPGYGHLHLVQLPLVVFGLVGVARHPTREKMLVVAVLLFYPLGGALSTDSPVSSRSILGTAAMAILSGYGLVVVARWAANIDQNYARVATAGTVGLIVVLACYGFGDYIGKYREYPNVSADYWGWQDGPQEIIEYFESVEADYDQLIMTGEFNAPHMFFWFYAPEGCNKCQIGEADRFDSSQRQLFALKPHQIAQINPSYDISTKHTVAYPDGSIAFRLVEIAASG